MMIFYKLKKVESLPFIHLCVKKFCDSNQILFENIIIQKNEKGKPICVSPTGIYLSLSHCDLRRKKKARTKNVLTDKVENDNEFFIFCAVSLAPVGLDIEFVTDFDYSLIKERCNLENITTINSFFANWVFAEAYYKMSDEQNVTILSLLDSLKNFLPPMAFEDNSPSSLVTKIESKDGDEGSFDVDTMNNCLTAVLCSDNLPNYAMHKKNSKQFYDVNTANDKIEQFKFFHSPSTIAREEYEQIVVKDEVLTKFYKFDDIVICVVISLKKHGT